MIARSQAGLWILWPILMLMTGIAAVAVAVRAPVHPASLILFGGTLIALSGYIIAHRLRSGWDVIGGDISLRPSTPAEIATLASMLPLCLLLIWAGLRGDPPTRLVTGKPSDVRSMSRQVFMPDGSRFGYVCEPRTRLWKCPAARNWDALPRWPRADAVRMEVHDGQILSLTIDGQVIVDREETRLRQRVLRLLCAASALLGSVVILAMLRTRVSKLL